MRTSPFVAGLVLASACSVGPISEQQFLHSLTVQPDGNPEELTVIPRNGGRTYEPGMSFANQVDAIVQSPAWQTKKRVLIFVHGGLNSIENGLARTGKLVPAILADTGGDTYPIMINWESGLGGAYGDRLFTYYNGERKGFWRWLASPFVLVADLGRAITRLPIVYWQQGSAAVERSFWGTEIEHIPTQWQSRVRLHPAPVQWRTVTKVTDGIFQFVPGLLRAVTTPLIDTVGFEGYQILQRRTDTLFFTNNELSNTNAVSRGAFYELMQRIPKRTEIILVGHSMGAIACNEVIRRFPTHNYQRIVYMAAACTTKDFMDAVPDYMREHPYTKFYGLCLHPAADAAETTWASTVPNGSLLEWLDAFVLGPRTMLHRTFGKWNNAIPMLPRLDHNGQQVNDRIFVKGFPVIEGVYPCTHGSFDEFCFWREAFWDPDNDDPVTRVDQLPKPQSD